MWSFNQQRQVDNNDNNSNSLHWAHVMCWALFEAPQVYLFHYVYKQVER